MVARSILVGVSCLLVAGCSSSSGLTTGSLIGGDAKKVAAAQAPVVKNDPLSRAFHVGASSARAVRCGFHFDAAKLKADFMAGEAASGLSVENMAKVGAAYSTGFNGVAKGITNAQTYCTPRRVNTIKASLTRYLAGDYTPPAPKKVVKTDGGGIFGGIFNGDEYDSPGPKFGTDEWWESQQGATGG